jgi:hypothetical protein
MRKNWLVDKTLRETGFGGTAAFKRSQFAASPERLN